jgi:hypothetical protein
MAITPAYATTLRELRDRNPSWGNAARHAAPVIEELKAFGIEGGTILDYGAGTGAFKRRVEELTNERLQVVPYDPSIPGWSELPYRRFHAVVCTHVLEHVEPLLLQATIIELLTRAKRLVYIEVPHGPATKLLADGRDAHLTQETRAWWLELLGDMMARYGFAVEVRPGMNPVNTQFIGRNTDHADNG